MNAAHLHILTSHVVVVGVPLVAFIFLLAFLKKSHPVFIAGCWMLLFVTLFAIPTYWAGGPAKELVEHLPHFDQEIQHTHENLGQYVLLANLVTGFWALVCLFYDSFRKKLPRVLITVMVLFLLADTALLLITANYGSKIIHQEVRSDGISSSPSED